MPRRRRRPAPPEAPEAAPAAPVRRELPPCVWAAFPYAVFAVLFAGTFGTWALPFQDSGREVMLASRLADGETLYAGVSSSYGPLPPLLDAGLFRLFGQHLGVLVAWRTLLSLAGIEALRRLLLRATGSGAAAGALAAAVVATCAFVPTGGAWPFPYSGAALMGSVGTWAATALALGSTGLAPSLAAGLLSGLAAGTKLELLPSALAGPLLALALARPRREALLGAAVAVPLAAAAWVVPVLIFGAETMRSGGYLVALAVPEAWKRLYAEMFWAGGSAGSFPVRLLTDIALPTALFAAPAALLALRPATSRPLALALFAAAGAASAALPENRGVQGLLLLGIAYAAGAALRVARRTAEPLDAALLAVAAAMASPLLRQPFSLLPYPYTAFTGPLALGAGLVALFRLGKGRPAVVAFAAGIAAGQAASQVRVIAKAPWETVRFPRGTLKLHPREASLVTEVVRELSERTRPEDRVGVFPEPGMVLFLAERRSPFRDAFFLPGSQDARAEDEMIRTIRQRPLAAGVIVNRPLEEFGARAFGVGYLERFRAELEAQMAVAAVLGPRERRAEPLPPWALADQALLLVPAGAKGPP